MKKIVCFLFVSTLFLAALPNCVKAQSAKGQQLHIIYIDNSERGGTNGGLSQNMLDYIFAKTLDSVNAKDKNISYFLYMSNGDNPYYSRTPDKFGNYINKLTERKLKYPSSLEDKTKMRSILYQDKLSGFSSIVIDFYVTDYYLHQELLGDYPGYLLDFFPKELQYVTNCPENNVSVNVYYPSSGGKGKDIEDKLFLSSKRFASNIRYNFIGK